MKLHANAAAQRQGPRAADRSDTDPGWSLAQAAEAAGVSDRTAFKWLAPVSLRRSRQGLLDRSSAPMKVA